MFRTRFARDIVAEFLPPAKKQRRQRVIILCDGMPSIPRKQPLAEFLSGKGFWVVYPRYRGSWESSGQFLARSPHLDILDVVGELARPRGAVLRDAAFGKQFALRPSEIFVIGGSFGGAAAALCSLDPRVKRVIANCPVVDWSILNSEKNSETAETSNPSYAAYIREAFGQAYRLSDRNWAKLRTGRFYNPAQHIKQIDPSKILMFHAKDDPYVPWQSVERFARSTGARLRLLARGGHLSTDRTVRRYWREIAAFFA